MVEAIGDGVADLQPGDNVIVYPGLYCGTCPRCQKGQENLCEDIGGIMGFHVDGMARELLDVPAHRALKVPNGVSLEEAACTTVTFATVQHMLFDNAQLDDLIIARPAAAGSARPRSRWRRPSGQR